MTYFDIVLLTSCAQFFLPAQLALIKDIVEEPKQDQAIEMTQAIQALAVVLGPPLAAGLVFGLGIEWALGLNAVTFALIFLMTRAIAAPPAGHEPGAGEMGHFSREFLAGVGYVWQHAVLRTILIAEILTWLGFGALQSLGYFFITEDLHAPPSSYGLLGADFGLRRDPRRRAGDGLWQAHRPRAHPVGRADHGGRLRDGDVAPDELRAGVGGGVPLRGGGDGDPDLGGAALDRRDGEGVRGAGDGGDQSGGAAGGAGLDHPGGALVGTVLHSFRATILGITSTG